MAKRLRSNAVAGTVEQIVVGIGFFITYAVLIRETSTELVGILSLVLVLASVGSMAGAGFASALNHFVPLFESTNARDKTVTCIDTTLLCTSLLYISAIAISYVPFTRLVEGQAGPANAPLVAEMMVPVVVHVLAIGVGSTTSLALTALLRNDLRLASTTAGQIIGIVVLLIIVPRTGIIGGVWAMVAQSVTTAVLAWVQLTRILPELGAVPRRFEVAMARRLVGLGANMQLQTLLLAAIEPITRLMVGQFGTLSAVAYFSMASRFVIQMRALVYSGSQSLLSAFSHSRSGPQNEFARLYGRARATVQFLAIAVMSAAVGAAPFVADVWLGSLEWTFVTYVAILSVGWAANTVTLVSYFNAYSLGKINFSLAGHFILAVLTFVLGLTLGNWFGAIGAVLGMGVALFASALFLAVANGTYAPPGAGASHLVANGGFALAAAAAAAAAVAAYPWLRTHLSPFPSGLASGCIWALVLAPTLFLHQVSREAWQRLRR